MGIVASVITDSAKLSLGYSKRLLADVSVDGFGKFAVLRGQKVVSNHPAFIYGHLSIYPVRILEQLGQDATSCQPSQQYLDLFSQGAECQDDPDGSIYPPKEEITGLFFQHYEAAITALEQAEDSLFSTPNPNEQMRTKFGTLGAMHAFYTGGHIMIHMGQMSAWRRMNGLGVA